MTAEQLKQGIAELDDNIAQGKRFEEQGYDCDMMLAITYSLRDKLAGELSSKETTHD